MAFKYGSRPPYADQLNGLLQACKNRYKEKKRFGLSWDETDPRDGLGLEEIITYSEFDAMTDEQIVENLGTKILQIYFKEYTETVLWSHN